ncbi:MAG: hypothetical protein OEN50_10095 [Deltaproteobacteria bacterium]|nr:hypothetical protein [Deltaproteobacteria bacterium]
MAVIRSRVTDNFYDQQSRNNQQTSRNLVDAMRAQGLAAQMEKQKLAQEFKARMASAKGDPVKQREVLMWAANAQQGLQSLDRRAGIKQRSEDRAAQRADTKDYRDDLATRDERDYALKERQFNATQSHRAQSRAISRAGAGGGGGGSPFGSGIQGRSLTILTNLAPGYRDGTLNEGQTRIFESALTHYTQPKSFVDPDSGLMTTRQPELPAFVQEALDIRKGGATTTPTDSAPETPATPVAGPAAAESTSNETAWDLAPLISGVGPSVAEGIGKTPILGSAVHGPWIAKRTQARTYVPIIQRELLRVMANNPKYAVGEQEAIAKEISIEGKFWDNESAYKDRLVGIDEALEGRQNHALATSTSPKVGREERIHAKNVLNGIINFRRKLGVPVRVRNDADFQKLKSGTKFIGPDKVPRRKP